ncbi:hypothetical protein [Herbaspirillum sp.]|uniref:hypothetical protein n=1 Tax=Herbaspirillum sp. TaxID=1890675 RepID=UPI001B0FAEBA|nr:hypothetical protein [Herbaspirillum sp.]MBO9537872.1 hypothetical protein [Herbaspirillum sp.]
MRISSAICAIAFLSLTPNAQAESMPSNAEKILSEIFPSMQIRSTTMGDLDGDGISDIATVLAGTSAGEHAQQIVVLQGVQPGQYQLWSRSNPFAELRKGGPDLEIRKGSIFLYYRDVTCCAAGYRHLQFKFNGQQFRLIGVRVGETSTREEDDFERDVSFNVITGDKVETKRVGKQKKQIKTKIPTKESQALDEFGMDLASWIEDAIQFDIKDDFGAWAPLPREK